MENKLRGAWVLYDRDCAFCTSLAVRFGPTLQRQGFELAPLQNDCLRPRLWSRAEEQEMLLLTSTGEIFGGAEALVKLSRHIYWGWPLWVLAQVPGTAALLRSAYRWVAARRDCVGKACKVERRNFCASENGLGRSRTPRNNDSNASWLGWMWVFGLALLALVIRPSGLSY